MSNEKDWDIVEEAWDSETEECVNCEFYSQEYYTDTGHEVWCRLLEEGGCPQHCAAFDRLQEEKGNE